jgi:diaminopimelate epimerase
MALIKPTGSIGVEVERVSAAVVRGGLTGHAHTAILHGNGNVIAVVELTGEDDDPLPLLRSATLTLCAEVRSVRVDGVLFCYPAHRRGLRMVFFDRDGTWEAVCGNGLRCLTRYAADRGLFETAGVVVTDDGDKAVRALGERVEVVIGAARQVRQVDPDRWFAYTGVAHLVVFLPDTARLSEVDVRAEGARLRYDTALCADLGHPGGVHVDFAAVEPLGLAVRTYEVGVEDETLCCGTGVVAAAALAEASGHARLPLAVRTLGGEVLVSREGAELTLTGDVGYLAGAPRGLALPVSSGAERR